MNPKADPARNLLLAALPVADFERIGPHLEPVEFELGAVLYESGERLRYLYFPTTTIVSLLYVTENGSSTELAVTGYEGAVGIALFMGGDTTNSRAVVQSAGAALRLPASILEDEFRRGGSTQWLLLRFTQALIAQMTQTAVCNRHHSLEQQLCRWLLISLDRLQSNKLRMTQQLIADMLGVRREGVTEAAGRLQQDGAIRYTRGEITILDRARLEQYVCECYGVVNAEYNRLLKDVQIPRQNSRIDAS
jgi:CRP-like cAMP-binding protein